MSDKGNNTTSGGTNDTWNPMIKVVPRTLPGTISESNRGACDW